jgi:hypothetical protein
MGNSNRKYLIINHLCNKWRTGPGGPAAVRLAEGLRAAQFLAIALLAKWERGGCP